MLGSTLPLLFAAVASAQLTSKLTEISDFGPNPRNASMYIYVPANLPANPPILVSPHWCHGTAQQVFEYRPWASLGDEYGFISIYPNVTSASTDQCWDVSSRESLTHNGGGDALSIVSMVRWTLEKYHADASRVFVTGTSSGAMMTNVLIGSYPDVFAAGSAWAGVPFACFAGDGYGLWNEACAQGQIIRTGDQWAALVRNAYPTYRGFRPKLQTLHGTDDTVLYAQNFREQIKQWTSVLGVSQKPTEITDDVPFEGWTRFRYGDVFEAYEAKGITHDIPTDADTVMDFFDLKCRGLSCYSRPRTGNGTGYH